MEWFIYTEAVTIIILVDVLMVTTVNESDIIERLNSASSARGFFIVTSEIFEQAIDALTQRIFCNNYLAVNAVVKPLLGTNGPLEEVSVRLKLLFGLGVIPDKIYHDIESLLKIKDFLNNDVLEYQFTDHAILEPIKKLSVMKTVSNIEFDLFKPNSSEMDTQLYQLYMSRIQQVIRSSLSLGIVEICNRLDIDSPFTTMT